MATAVTRQPRDGFSISLFLALALHVILLLGLGFSALEEAYDAPQLEVTLVRVRSDIAPEQADHLAQQHQQGSGDQAEHSRLAGGQALPLPAGQVAQRAEQDARQQHNRQVITTRSSDLPPPEARDTVSAVARLDQGRQGIASPLPAREASLNDAPEESVQAEASRAPRTRRITAASARAAVDAAYLHDWERRVENVGNQYYPEASIRYGIYGSLRLLVVVDHLGQLLESRVLSSSGHAVLDEAALKIVRMAAPFAPFPPALKATTDRLEIVRIWHFQENRLSSG